MSYPWDVIQCDWLDEGAELSLPPDEVVARFEDVERVLGRDAVERRRRSSDGSVTRGLMPTLQVIDLGNALRVLDGVANTGRLIAKLRKEDPSAHAELQALFLLRVGDLVAHAEPGLHVELEPEVRVGGSVRRPDLRARKGDGPWVYVEVTSPEAARAMTAIAATQQKLVDGLLQVAKPFSAELYLRRDLRDAEILHVTNAVLAAIDRGGTIEEPIGELGQLWLNHTAPGEIAPHPLAGADGARPVTALARAVRTVVPEGCVASPTTPDRQVVVRVAFSDERAERLLRHESAQLPTDAPGLVMFDIAGNLGGPKQWSPLLRRRLQPTLNTRIGGIAMFTAGYMLGQDGFGLRRSVELLENPHAAMPLPEWVGRALRASGTEG